MNHRGFLLQEQGRSGLVAIFEDDGETGWLYLYNSDNAASGKQTIVVAAPAYNRGHPVQPREEDVWLAWSEDFSKCAVIIRGSARPIVDDFRVIIDAGSKLYCHKLWDGHSLGIQDLAWLQGFEWTWREDSH